MCRFEYTKVGMEEKETLGGRSYNPVKECRKTEGMTMSDGFQIALTALAAVGVYVIGHILVTAFVEPIFELRRSIGEVRYILAAYGDIHTYPALTEYLQTRPLQRARYEETRDALRRLGARLDAQQKAVPWYGFWEACKVVKARTQIWEASQEMARMGNMLWGYSEPECKKYAEMNRGIVNRIRKILGIET